MPGTFFVEQFTRPRSAGQQTRSLKVSMIGDAGTTLQLGLAPKLQHDGLANRFSIEERVNQKPLLRESGKLLRTYTYSLVLIGRDIHGYLDGQVSVEEQLKILRALARTSQRISWRNFGPSEGGQFIITSMSVADDRRKFHENDITQAVVSVTMTEVSDPAAAVGPLTGGAQTTPITPADAVDAATAAPIDAPADQTYTVVRGDTLSAIAQRFLGDAGKYHDLADWNGITNTDHINVGQVLVLKDPRVKRFLPSVQRFLP